MGSKQRLVLVTKNQNGDTVIMDVLDPKSTWNNPIMDYSKIRMPGNNDDVFHQMMFKHGSKSVVDTDVKTDVDTVSPYQNLNEEIVEEGHEYEEPHVHVEILTDLSGKIVDKSIMQDMADFYIADHIKEKANDIYTKLEISTKRGGRRKKVIFFCLFNAHRELNIPCDPRVLANAVGIESNDISKAFSMCSPIETGYYPRNKRFTYMDFIPIYYHLTGLSTLNLSDVEELGREISEKHSSIWDELPQTVAAAILMYYMEINGVTCTFDFSKTVNRSEMTLVQMKKQIESIHNS